MVSRSKAPIETPCPSGQGTELGSHLSGSDGQIANTEAIVSSATPSNGSQRLI